MHKSIDNNDPYTRLRGGTIIMRGRWVKPGDTVRGEVITNEPEPKK